MYPEHREVKNEGLHQARPGKVSSEVSMESWRKAQRKAMAIVNS